MKISTIGKFFFGALAVKAAVEGIQRMSSKDDDEDSNDFSDEELDRLLDYAKMGDYVRFEKLYALRRPGVGRSVVGKRYGQFANLATRK